MSNWKSITEMPDDFNGDVWVFSKKLKEPELAYTYICICGKEQGKRLFETIHSVDSEDGTYREYFTEVSHYIELVAPQPPQEAGE